MPYFLKIQSMLTSAYTFIISFIKIILANWQFRTFLLIITLLILIYLNYQLTSRFIIWKNLRKEKKECQLRERDEIEYLLNENLENLSSHELIKLREKLTSLKYGSNLSNFKQEIYEKVKEINSEMMIALRKETIDDLELRREEVKKEIEELEIQIHEKEKERRQYEETSLKKLDAQNTSVYLEEDLNIKEKELLLKHNYKKAYEFCILKQEFIHVLVKPTLNHSITHTFLVWSVIKYLNTLPEITDILDWDTREADITFKTLNKTFAIEIETGTLLSKKRQLRAKYDYLQSKYKGRAITLVSKKSLHSAYNKFGLVSSRSDFPKKLKKLLKSA